MCEYGRVKGHPATLATTLTFGPAADHPDIYLLYLDYLLLTALHLHNLPSTIYNLSTLFHLTTATEKLRPSDVNEPLAKATVWLIEPNRRFR